jgi:hypothetical protein
MRRYLGRRAGVNAGRPTPYFDQVVTGSQILCAPNCGIVTDMRAGVYVGRPDVFANDADFVGVHGKLIQISNSLIHVELSV